MAKGMTLQEAIDKAPDWATHISVSKYSGRPEFYNSVKDYSSCSVIGNRVHNVGKEFTDKLTSGDTEWEFVPIAPVSLEND